MIGTLANLHFIFERNNNKILNEKEMCKLSLLCGRLTLCYIKIQDDIYIPLFTEIDRLANYFLVENSSLK